METIQIYELKDLDEEIQEEIIVKNLNKLIELKLNLLAQTLKRGDITETEYYNRLGCSKRYAETADWFVASCYHDKHKRDLNEEVIAITEMGLYSESGRYVGLNR